MESKDVSKVESMLRAVTLSTCSTFADSANPDHHLTGLSIDEGLGSAVGCKDTLSICSTFADFANPDHHLTGSSIDSGQGSDVGHKQSIARPLHNSLLVSTSTSTARHFVGTALQFLRTLLSVSDYRSWDPVKDIKDRAGPSLLEECRSLMWDQEGSDKEL